MRVAELPSRFVGAARLVEVRIAGYAEFSQRRCILQNWCSWWGRAGLPRDFVYKEGFKDIESGFDTIPCLSNCTKVSAEFIVWLWPGRTSPYRRGCGEALWSDPRHRVVMALRNGLSVSKSPFTTRPRVDGPAPAEPAEMAERQSRPFYGDPARQKSC